MPKDSDLTPIIKHLEKIDKNINNLSNRIEVIENNLSIPPKPESEKIVATVQEEEKTGGIFGWISDFIRR